MVVFPPFWWNTKKTHKHLLVSDDYIESEKINKCDAEQERQHREEVKKEEQRRQRETNFQEELKKIIETKKVDYIQLNSDFVPSKKYVNMFSVLDSSCIRWSCSCRKKWLKTNYNRRCWFSRYETAEAPVLNESVKCLCF